MSDSGISQATAEAKRGAAVGSTRGQRYLQLLLLVVAAGAIYPMLYLRQVYQTTMLDVFAINDEQLGYLYSSLGTLFLVSYLPSGWLADRIAPRLLICFSLIGTGLLGVWYATAPSFPMLMVIFCGWGITTGLTFWAAVIKRVNTIAHDEQGRFFGLLDGGRGLIEALLATIAIALFAYVANTRGDGASTGFKLVVHMYAFLCIGLGVLLALVKDTESQGPAVVARTDGGNVLTDLKQLASIPELWLVTAIVFCGYQVFWATYSFAPYLQEGGFGLSAVAAGMITTLKLWMRPVGGIGGGFLGDRFSKVNILILALVLAAFSLIVLVVSPGFRNNVSLVILVLFIGVLTYAIRGLYWALLDDCNVPPRISGLAIGLISVLGYSPDVFLPLLNGYFTQKFPGALGYQIYFCCVAFMALLGAVAALVLRSRLNNRKLGAK
jgi:MFS family permease